MKIQRLQTRFLLAGCLLASFPLLCGIWNARMLERLSREVDQTLRNNETNIDLAAAIADSLEREDDALLLGLSGSADQAKLALNRQRQLGDERYQELHQRLLGEGNAGVKTSQELRGQINAYRDAASALLDNVPRAESLKLYHEQVNLRLRQVVQECSKIRERNFAAMRLSGVRARDEARFAQRVVILGYAAALLLSVAVALWLARSVVRPILALNASVEALRQGDFSHRVPFTSSDEIGRLSEGFNRMAATLWEYRQSSLGELLTAKSTLESTLNALPNAVLVFAPDGGLATVNPPARAILNTQTAAERITSTALPPELRKAVEAALRGQPLRPARADFSHVFAVELDEQLRKHHLTAVPIPNFEPRRTGAVLVLDDVTEFALLDELRGELIAAASHELKTPLTSLRMNIMLLDEGSETFSSRQREMIQAARLACEELGSTIDELLDITRIESGQLRLDITPVDLRIILHSVIRGLQTRLDDAQVTVQVQAPHHPTLVRGDATRLKNVLSNLLSNALKYSRPGESVGVDFTLVETDHATERAFLQITVNDTGPGVPSPFRERIFEKFFRVEHHLNHATDRVAGTGIGLYLCREIVKAHGGSIWCEAGRGGVGTVIAFRLPLQGS